MRAITTGGDPIAAAISARPGPTTPSRTSPRSGSSAGLSSAASSMSTSEPHRSAGQDRRPSSGTPQAPQAGRRQVRHEQAAQAWPPADSPGHRPPGRSPGKGESAVGTPPDPRRADEARRDGRAVHRVGDPACGGHRPSAARLRPDLAAVPARPGCRDPRG